MEILIITRVGERALEDDIQADPDIILALMALQIGHQPKPEFKSTLLKLGYANIVQNKYY